MGTTANSQISATPRRLSLRRTWYALIVILCLAPAVYATLSFFQHFKRASLHDAAREIFLINETIKSRLEYAIDDTRTMLRTGRRIFRQRHTADGAVQDAVSEEVRQSLYQRFDALALHKSTITGIYLVDGAEHMLALWHRDEVLPHRQGAGPVASKASGNSLYFMLPLSEVEPAQGMIWAELSVDALWQTESNPISRMGYRSYLLDGKGRVLAGGQAPWLKNASLTVEGMPPPQETGLEFPPLQTFAGPAGETVHGAALSLAGTDWHVLTAVSRQSVLAPVYQTLHKVLIALAIILVLLVVLGMRMVKGMLGHFSNLLAAFSRALRDDYSPLVLSSVFNEYAQIKNAYNRLVSSLAAREEGCKVTEAALCESVRQNQSLINNIPGAIFRSGYQGHWELLYISDVIEDISGYPARGFLPNAARSYDSIIDPADQETVRKTVAQAVEQHEPYVVEYRIRAMDGSERWVHEKGQPVFDDEDTLLWRDGVIFDVTSRKQAEQQHRRLYCEYRALAKVISDVMFTIDVGGELTWYNENLERYSSLSAERLKGLPVENLFVADRRHDIDMMIAACYEKGTAEIEAEFLAVSGPSPYLVKMVVLRDDDGEIVGIVGCGRDLSHHRQLEKQLRQSQKMQSLGQLTSGIAHDFNNFLTAINGFTNLALQHIGNECDAKMTMYLDEVHKAGARAQKVVAQMLSFSRGGKKEDAMPLDLLPLLKETINMMSASLPSSIELHLESRGFDAQVMADPVQLQQVIMNLCINARDAMGGQGRVHIELTERHDVQLVCDSCRETVAGDFTELSICDAGCGIRSEVLERIFEPFFSTKAAGKGTGMGLAMVHDILHQQGGHIQVESHENKGTTFRLLFPRLAQDALSPESGETTPVALPPHVRFHGRVLIVDNEPAVGTFLAELLRSRGCATTVLSDSREAMALFRRDPQAFDLLLTDLTMPGLSGIELAEEILTLQSELPIILCTGYGEQIDELRAKYPGIQRYLSKPIDIMTFLDAVYEQLGDKV